jgi:hypothetical protein
MHQPPRRLDLSSQQDTVLVCAVATVLVIRLQLWVTNYPQLGGGKLHIAHLLWGGLLMLVSIGLLLSYHGPRVRRVAAVLGGIGFGFFVDELGKFITADNDYFFKPATGVIYVVFILLFFLTRWLRRRHDLNPRESLVNAAGMVGEAALHDLDAREQRQALELLNAADPADPLVAPLRELLARLESLPVRPPGRMTRAARWIRRHYYAVIERPWFPRLLRVVFTVLALVSLLAVLGLVFDFVVFARGTKINLSVTDAFGRLDHISFTGWVNVASALVAAVLLWIGVVRLGESRLDGYRWIERALLVSICLVQVFLFVQSQFLAVLGLSIEVILLVTVKAMMRAELKLAERQRAQPLPVGPQALAAATRATGAALVLALALGLAFAPVAGAKRITVAVVGDSVQEGFTAADYANDFASIDPPRAGLTPVLRQILAGQTGARPGTGFIPAHPALWKLSGDWLETGYGFGTAGPFGASGYGFETTDASATATIDVAEPDVAVLYWRGPGGGTFTVAAGGRTWPIDTSASRPDGGGETWLHLPGRAGTVTIGGPADGRLIRFTGLLARRPAPRHAIQYEVSNLAHAGRRAGEDITPANRQAYERLRIDLTLIMSGTTDEMTSDYIGGSRWIKDYDGGLRYRARVARRTGRCVIVPPAPLPVKTWIQHAYFRVGKRVAREEHCTFAHLLSQVWPSSKASIAKHLTTEGIHPTRAGYVRISRALVPAITRELGLKHIDGRR